MAIFKSEAGMYYQLVIVNIGHLVPT